MKRIPITPELANFIRSARKDLKLTIKKLSACINKSPAYISKLETGRIHTIREEDLNEILDCLFGEHKNLEVFISPVSDTPQYVEQPEEHEEYISVYNFDMIIRQVPIPASLIDEINGMMEKSVISPEYLLQRINANESLPENIKKQKNPIVNKWFLYNNSVYVYVSMEITELLNILQKVTKATSYTFILAIEFYLLKIIAENEVQNPSLIDTSKIMTLAEEKLNAHRFFSLYQKTRLLNNAAEEEGRTLNTEHDNENDALLSRILIYLRLYSEISIINANQELQMLLRNLEWNSSFIMRLLSLRFFDIGDSSYTYKKSLLSDIGNLLEKYTNAPEIKKREEIF